MARLRKNLFSSLMSQVSPATLPHTCYPLAPAQRKTMSSLASDRVHTGTQAVSLRTCVEESPHISLDVAPAVPLQEVGFFDVTRTGELLSRLSEDTSVLQNAATVNLSEAMRSLATSLLGLSYMLATSLRLTGLHALCAPHALAPHTALCPTRLQQLFDPRVRYLAVTTLP